MYAYPFIVVSNLPLYFPLFLFASRSVFFGLYQNVSKYNTQYIVGFSSWSYTFPKRANTQCSSAFCAWGNSNHPTRIFSVRTWERPVVLWIRSLPINSGLTRCSEAPDNLLAALVWTITTHVSPSQQPIGRPHLRSVPSNVVSLTWALRVLSLTFCQYLLLPLAYLHFSSMTSLNIVSIREISQCFFPLCDLRSIFVSIASFALELIHNLHVIYVSTLQYVFFSSTCFFSDKHLAHFCIFAPLSLCLSHSHFPLGLTLTLYHSHSLMQRIISCNFAAAAWHISYDCRNM